MRVTPLMIVTALVETGTGLLLLVWPALVFALLFGWRQAAPETLLMSRVAGIALIGLGVACWPGPPLAGMVTYGVVVTLYLAYVGLAGGVTGILLWPAVVLHVILTGFLIRGSTRMTRR